VHAMSLWNLGIAYLEIHFIVSFSPFAGLRVEEESSIKQPQCDKLMC
jgi:hypothetical protein